MEHFSVTVCCLTPCEKLQNRASLYFIGETCFEFFIRLLENLTQLLEFDL